MPLIKTPFKGMNMENTEKRICLGEIVAAHGIKGHVKIKTFTEIPERVGAYGPLYDDKNKTYIVHVMRPASEHAAIAAIEGINSRNDAESLRGTSLYIDRDQLPDLDNDQMYHEDLMGLSVCTSEKGIIGYILSVQNYGAGDFIDIMLNDHRQATLPLHDESICHIDMDEKKMTINEEFLLI
jgi:16S rRNA processing protein RimM